MRREEFWKMTSEEFWERVTNPADFDVNRLVYELVKHYMNWSFHESIAKVTSKISKQELHRRLFAIKKRLEKVNPNGGFDYFFLSEEKIMAHTFD
jgi:hypothetical protein